VVEPGLPEKIVAIHERLSRAKTPHAFGGALSLAYYAEPRATIDIDLNVFVTPDDFELVAAALAELGVQGRRGVEARVQRDGQCRLWWGRTPVDLYFSYDALHEAMREGVRREPFADTTIPVLAPEHLVVCKALFNRPKDWLDIEQVIVGVDELDADEVSAWMDRIVGEDDPRTLRLHALIAS